jgi:hypothetical protein
MAGGTYRGVFSKLFDDLDYQQLTPYARLTLVTLRLCAQNSAASIFRYYPEVLRSQTGLTNEILDATLAELERSPSSEAPWIFREGPVVWVRNGLRHDPNIRLADKKHMKSVERAVASLPRLQIVARFCDYYRIERPFDGPPKALGRPLEDPSPPSSSTSTRTIPPGRVFEGPSSNSSQNGRLINGRWPAEMFNRDCLDPAWREYQCVRSSWVAEHPGEPFPSKRDGTPKQCAVHRGAIV